MERIALTGELYFLVTEGIRLAWSSKTTMPITPNDVTYFLQPMSPTSFAVGSHYLRYEA
jgi:hypothetical protein